MYPKSIQKLIDIFSKFPTVGPRTAARFVFHLLKKPKGESDDLVSSILELKNNIKICGFCFKPFEPSFASASAKATGDKDENELCEICSDPRRNKSLLCIVEKETDLISIENTKKYQGLYFVLGGTVSKFKNEDTKNARMEELVERLKNPGNFGISTNFEEIILAINPTSEGEETILYLERLIKPLNKKITRLGRGLPIGAELEYADEETLSSAFENRK